MPSAGTRRSTRVFVPKISSGVADADASGRRGSRVLRSGKRLAVNKSTDGWQEDFCGRGTPVLLWGKGEDGETDHLGFSAESKVQEAQMANAGVVVSVPHKLDDLEENLESSQIKKFAVVYERKRQRQLSDSASSSSSSVADATYMNRRFGIVYVRKRHWKKLKVAPLPQRIEQNAAIVGVDCGLASRESTVLKKGLRFPTLAEKYAKKFGITKNSFCTSITDPVVLLLIAESSHTRSSLLISRLIICILKWMRRAILPLMELVAFIFSGSFASIFSQQGVHILPLRWQSDNIVFTNPWFSCGLCRIYDTRQSIPVIWLDFMALPSFFRSLHANMLLQSLYLSHIIMRYLKISHFIPIVTVSCQRNDSIAHGEADFLGTVLSWPSVMQSPEQNANHDAYKSDSENAITLCDLSKRSRKRSSLRYLRSQNSCLTNMHAHPQISRQFVLNVSAVNCEAKQNVLQEVMVKPISIETPDHHVEDSLSFMDESDASTPPSAQRQRKSAKKSSTEQTKELKYALAEVKQNIDSVHCSANVLFTDVDRCWREEGFEVMLDLLGSQEWVIAVKLKDEARYLHKSLDIRPCVVNRFTHAFMWAGDHRWKLEFLDRWDWLVFKELQMECCERNLQESSSRMIPVPVFKEVSGYEEGSDPNFSRPDVYIRMEEDEVQRALLSKIARYDMDSGDEQWLIKQYSSNQRADVGLANDISVDEFEKLIYAMEKDFYRNVDDVFDKEKALNLYQHFGKREMLLSIYDYWRRKRSKKHAALVREFQGPPLRQAQFIHKPILRKKRSLKRKRSQTIRTKLEFLEQAHDGALKRLQEAENAAKRAAELAVHLRNRAQILTLNAELAVCKSVMALRIADSILASSETKDPASLVLD